MEIKEAKARLRLQDVQNLVLWVLAEGHNPQFAFIKNKALVSQVVLLYVPGLDEPLLRAKSHLLHTFSTFLGPPIPVLARSSTQRPHANSLRAVLYPHDTEGSAEEGLREVQGRAPTTLSAFPLCGKPSRDGGEQLPHPSPFRVWRPALPGWLCGYSTSR